MSLDLGEFADIVKHVKGAFGDPLSVVLDNEAGGTMKHTYDKWDKADLIALHDRPGTGTMDPGVEKFNTLLYVAKVASVNETNAEAIAKKEVEKIIANEINADSKKLEEMQHDPKVKDEDIAVFLTKNSDYRDKLRSPESIDKLKHQLLASALHAQNALTELAPLKYDAKTNKLTTTRLTWSEYKDMIIDAQKTIDARDKSKKTVSTDPSITPDRDLTSFDEKKALSDHGVVAHQASTIDPALNAIVLAMKEKNATKDVSRSAA